MAKEKRFIQIFSQESFLDNSMEIWVDTKTGVNYLYTQSGNAGGLTALLDRDGKPIITTVPSNFDQ